MIEVTASQVRSHGDEAQPLPGSGRIDFTPETHSVYNGALRGRDTVHARVTAGAMTPVHLTPGPWRVQVRPDHGRAWESWLVELEDQESVDLVDVAPVIVVDGEKWARGGRGPAGASVTDARDNGDQTMTFLLSDGGEAGPVTVPAGPRGATGQRGETGPEGPRGEAGARGERGSTGADSTVPGPPGPAGDTGPAGDPGQDGAPGPAGVRGESGDPGPEGPKGPKGDEGQQGTPGRDAPGAEPDTGWRDLASLLVAPHTGGTVHVRRVGQMVHWRAIKLATSGAGFIIPAGSELAPFMAEASTVWLPRIDALSFPLDAVGRGEQPGWFTIERTTWGSRVFVNTALAPARGGTLSHYTDRPFPTGTLPGAPIT